MQPYFFPYIGYWQLIKCVDTFVLLDDVNFINRGWINRNRILHAGAAYMITVPLSRASQNRKIYEIEIHPDEQKRNKMLKTLGEAYAKSPGKKLVIELVNQVLSFRGHLADALYASISNVCAVLGFAPQILRSSQLESGKDKTGHHKLIAITRHLGGNIYVNPPGGRDLYSHRVFEDAGLDLKFIVPAFTPYSQRSTTFVPGLSILDFLASGAHPIDALDNYTLSD